MTQPGSLITRRCATEPLMSSSRATAVRAARGTTNLSLGECDRHPEQHNPLWVAKLLRCVGTETRITGGVFVPTDDLTLPCEALENLRLDGQIASRLLNGSVQELERACADRPPSSRETRRGV